MGREIRKVPPNWESPPREDRREGPQPMYDQYVGDAIREWKENYKKWEDGTHEDLKNWGGDEYWEYDPPPNKNYYRPWKDEEATWFQVWETVSEGTPVTPAFETLNEVCKYLAENGDYWDQLREFENCKIMSGGPWGWERAKAFIKSGSACSMMVIINDNGSEIYESRDISLKLQEKNTNE